jgi:putative ABC transport system permease protein
VLGLDPDLPLYRTMTLAQVVDEALWNQRVSSRLVYFLTAIALGLSTVGLYAVTSHAVGQRTREIGLRMALGARPRHVRRLVIRRAAVQLALGLTAGILCNLAWDRMFSVGDRALLSPMDPLPLMMVSAVVVLVAGVACLMPVRRAVRMDPVAALRQE